ncbi:lymphocyte antigen 6E-like [Rhinatrema bivittatum]|uniref:lymphocyte antigen 6E-like n=1 Tax=Rhinatrema bivittatum TaxID=194408 RepID=UPI001126D12D|nr:lymphocyte antigen 6E-like [Rhinatrema bivittatum]
MSGFLLSLLAAALCVQTAEPLVCFQCLAQTSNWNCLQPVACEDSDNYCMTTVQSAGLGSRTSYISKGCAPICIATNVDVMIAGSSTSCCNSFLCNISGATSVKVSYTVLALSAALLGVLVRAGL